MSVIHVARETNLHYKKNISKSYRYNILGKGKKIKIFKNRS